ncbi:hypothetical protein I553_10833 [Mycobacterium xenopi 4042]|uniref:Uncharacterized protein n=1 Tax=Mycobacterium xenopi 4042 TaxID=1299334 RepID=X8DBT6_MYCXE|nr:hypothetical protein I553_10833 [Mycobacterium xenopi 4042]
MRAKARGGGAGGFGTPAAGGGANGTAAACGGDAGAGAPTARALPVLPQALEVEKMELQAAAQPASSTRRWPERLRRCRARHRSRRRKTLCSTAQKLRRRRRRRSRGPSSPPGMPPLPAKPLPLGHSRPRADPARQAARRQRTTRWRQPSHFRHTAGTTQTRTSTRPWRRRNYRCRRCYIRRPSPGGRRSAVSFGCECSPGCVDPLLPGARRSVVCVVPCWPLFGSCAASAGGRLPAFSSLPGLRRVAVVPLSTVWSTGFACTEPPGPFVPDPPRRAFRGRIPWAVTPCKRVASSRAALALLGYRALVQRFDVSFGFVDRSLDFVAQLLDSLLPDFRPEGGGLQCGDFGFLGGDGGLCGRDLYRDHDFCRRERASCRFNLGPPLPYQRASSDAMAPTLNAAFIGASRPLRATEW